MTTGEAIEGGYSPRRCYVLGAGFSKSCRFPLARELTEEVLQHVASENDPGIAELIAPTLDAWKDCLRHLYPTCDFQNIWPDFEDLITVLDESEAYRASYEIRPPRVGLMQPAHLKKVLLKHLGLLLCEKLSTCEAEALGVVGQFVQRATDAQHAIVSFNWDLLLEASAADAGLPVSYGGHVQGGLQLAKPHGSLNLAKTTAQRFEEMQNSINVRELQEEWNAPDSDELVVRATNPLDAVNRILHVFGNQDVLLVEPTARKSYQSAWLDLQWRRAMDMLRSAEEIVVIGYSLPLTDFRPRILLQLAGLSRDEQPRIRLVDPIASEVAAHYARFISLPTEPIETTWSEWLRSEE